MNDHELSTLVGAYALDALDEPERTLFEAHLADCTECTAEVVSLRAAAAELSHTTTISAPAAVRSELLSTISRVRPLPPPRAGAVTALNQRLPRRRLWPAIAAACALIAIATTGWAVQEHRQLTGHRVSPTALSSVFDSADLATATVSLGGSAHATLIYSKAKQRVVLIGQHIPAPPAGKTYQIWMLGPNGSAISGGVFRPDPDGTVLVQASGDLQHTAQMGISVEQAGGASRPTPGAIVADIAI